MKAIDLNADLGEYADEAGRAMEREILGYVTSCNIACGGHTGDAVTMRDTLIAAQAAGVSAGAHPSYPDREGFGRRAHGITHEALRASLAGQIGTLMTIADDLGISLTHVKPHGAVYNDAADDLALAALIAGVVAEAGAGLILVGLADGAMRQAAADAGLAFCGEAFVDRRYTPAGRLQPRGEEGAVIGGESDRLAQALALAEGKPVTASDGSSLIIMADTLCLHGDSPGAVATAKAVHAALEAAEFTLRPMAGAAP